jgi:hypothetical protein
MVLFSPALVCSDEALGAAGIETGCARYLRQPGSRRKVKVSPRLRGAGGIRLRFAGSALSYNLWIS